MLVRMTRTGLAASLTLAALLCAGAARAPARADTAAAFAIDAVRVSEPPNLDGNLDTPAWRSAAQVELGWDLTYQRPAPERTTAYLLYDDAAIYVAWRSWQASPPVATQHTDDVGGLTADDRVLVRLWPDGSAGFAYRFLVNPAGAHSATSSENAAYAPSWRSVAVTRPDGWIAMAAIPLKIMKSSGTPAWRIQFSRGIVAANDAVMWAYEKNASSDGDVTYAGTLRGLRVNLVTARPQPRFALYALGQVGTAATGGETSALGADLSLPLTRKTAFVGTFHPDYSNVERDQQTISPTEFARSFSEVRPFFTQLLNYFNNVNCNNCIDYRLLYTPSIPTPRSGYAVEGNEGLLKFAAFDAVGSGLTRADNAQSLRYSTPDTTRSFLYQRVGADLPGLHDVTQMWQANISNRPRNTGGYVTYADERGTMVSDPSAATWREAGAWTQSPTAGFYTALRKIGGQYAPFDGFTEHNDIAGYSLYGFKTWNFGPSAFIQSLTVAHSFDLYHGAIGMNQFDSNPSLSLNTRTQFGLSVSLGDNFLALGPNQAYDFNQNGVSLSYKGQTATPTSLSYFVGRFGNGNLRSWFRSTTLKLSSRTSTTFEADDTRYAADGGAAYAQWLMRGSLAYEINRGTSLAVGLRKIVGTAPPVFGPPSALNATNVSLALHRRLRADELFVVYGDPNVLYTRPAAIVKYVHYFGAEKGT
jgi:hypothetical protein